MILGIIGVVFAFIPLVGPFIAVPCVLVGLPLSISGFVKNRRRNQGKGMATAGVVCNSVALIMTIISIAITVSAVTEVTEEFGGDSSITSSSPSLTSRPAATPWPTRSGNVATTVATGGDTATLPPATATAVARSSDPGVIVTPDSTVLPPLGIGVSREKFELEFGGDVGFEFTDSPLTDGRPRRVGTSPDDAVTLELIGLESDLTQVTLVLPLAEAESDFLALYTMMAFAAVIPQYLKDGLEWFNDEVDFHRSVSMPRGGTFSNDYGDIQAAITFRSDSPTVFLSFTPPDTPVTAMALPTPKPTSSVWDPDRWDTGPTQSKRILQNGETLWAGGVGNGGLEPGLYEYRDSNGDKVVKQGGCLLRTNLGERGQFESELPVGGTFTAKLGPIHRYVSFGGCDGGLYLKYPDQPMYLT